MDHITELTLSKIAAVSRFETLRDEAEDEAAGPTAGVKPGYEFPVIPSSPKNVQAASRDALVAIDALLATVRDDEGVAALRCERDNVAAYIDGDDLT